MANVIDIHNKENWAFKWSRYNSFPSTWPHQRPNLSVSAMMKAGFRYVGPHDDPIFCDRVRCWQCKGTLYKFEPNDRPMEEHAKYFPGCVLVRDLVNEDQQVATTSMYWSLGDLW